MLKLAILTMTHSSHAETYIFDHNTGDRGPEDGFVQTLSNLNWIFVMLNQQVHVLQGVSEYAHYKEEHTQSRVHRGQEIIEGHAHPT
jgi:hypothetical protein